MGFFNLFSLGNAKTHLIKPVVLLVLDGWGLAPPSSGNAVTLAKTPNMNYLLENYPNTTLIASGEAVGLPANEVGNTEVGHLTMGSGRVILQDLKRINVAIEDKSFINNPAFIKAADHIKKHNSSFHIMGIYGSGRVHASRDHLFALLDFCKVHQIPRVYLHLFTDGRDSAPKEAIEIMPALETKLLELPYARIATIAGRYYGMDRDGRWDRIKRSYEAMVLGKGVPANSAAEALKQAYEKGLTDEFIEPTVIFDQGKPIATIEDNDAAIFYNFRIDRARQLTQAFVLPDFGTFNPKAQPAAGNDDVLFKPEFDREVILKNLFFVTMTEYHEQLPVSAIAFPTQVVNNSLPEVLSKRGLRQVQMAESEKERFVTFYFNGMKESGFSGTDVDIVPSPKVTTYDKRPQMSVFDIVNEFKKNLDKDIYHFFVINFANADMVGHSGNLAKTIEAVSITDKAIGEVVKATTAAGGTLIVTADHGNAEELVTLPTTSFFFTTDPGSMNTDHSNNPVPVIFVSKDFFQKKIPLRKGYLSDIAPTILAIMNIDKPVEMTGSSLFGT